MRKTTTPKKLVAPAVPATLPDNHILVLTASHSDRDDGTVERRVKPTACHCGHCRWCETKQAVLAMAERRGWREMWLGPATRIGFDGEASWRRFVEHNEEAEVAWALRVGSEEEEQRAATN